MFLEIIEDFAKLVFITGSLFLTLNTYIRYKQPTLSNSLHRQRFAVLFVLILITITLKITEDVIGGETGAVDEAILWFIHNHLPTTLTGVFEVITLSGSLYFLVPTSVVMTATMLMAKMRYESLLLISSLTTGAIVVYLLKTAVGRNRPSLWDTEWYWGASFPSGHTLMISVFLISIAIIVNRNWPAKGKLVFSIAFIWISLVALSRLVLGVHWPTDVLAAMCIGIFIPLIISAFIKAYYAKQGR